ncbi:hypothetical protein OK349_16100 [Sphingomonas sp. BT-65]|uniref:hypothetical protein n=1 Tax=Sphingomonas sp. BT-65 TaxID=2989821 RepID=UPI002235F0A2|nr:hypothetical protein [Sphingomonas sp. BT-65]MCW4463236.1 hypothetical protein [Sphingomonas sp. BT-65]
MTDQLPAVLGMIDPRRARRCDITRAKGPAYFVPFDRREDHIFVSGGERPYAVLLGGQWAGEGFALDRAENWHGVAVEGIDVRADFVSAFSPSMDGKRRLAIVVARGRLGIFASIKEENFGQTIIVGLDGDFGHSDTEERLAFSEWKIVLRQGDDDITLAMISAV